MLREGMLRCLESKQLSRITVSDLCKESGINRATFYNHYDSPSMILRELAYEYANQITAIYESRLKKESKNTDTALEECLAYISERKSELKVLFSDHAEHYLSGACLEIINEKVMQKVLSTSAPDRQDEFLLSAAASASAIYGFIQVWLTRNINKTPGELAVILRQSANGNIFL